MKFLQHNLNCTLQVHFWLSAYQFSPTLFDPLSNSNSQFVRNLKRKQILYCRARYLWGFPLVTFWTILWTAHVIKSLHMRRNHQPSVVLGCKHQSSGFSPMLMKCLVCSQYTATFIETTQLFLHLPRIPYGQIVGQFVSTSHQYKYCLWKSTIFLDHYPSKFHWALNCRSHNFIKVTFSVNQS